MGGSNFYNILFSEELYLVNEPAADYTPAEEPDAHVPDNSASTGPAFTVSGLSNAPTLVLFSYPAQPGISGEDQDFLSRVLGAARQPFEQVARLNVSSYPQLRWEDIAKASPASFVLAFGVPAPCLPEGMKDGEIYTIDNKRVVCAAPLGEIAVNNNRKKMLWDALKEIYNL